MNPLRGWLQLCDFIDIGATHSKAPFALVAGQARQHYAQQAKPALPLATMFCATLSVLILSWTMPAPAQAQFATSDFEGTWRFYAFADLPGDNSPVVVRALLTFNASGALTSGTVFDVFGDQFPLTGGSVTVNSD